ncbi:MAG: hypothetical protein UX72_C0003G0054 [Parcubacteria group bacterium GW2011_GWA2_47_10]|nr:MAG: hypothetical protein UX72_C0003G0054 [Parcubacteria group bacterium GW2011_GWA2_47_10]
MRKIILFLCIAFVGAPFAYAASEMKGEPTFFPSRESCPDGYYWHTVMNSTEHHLRVFVDGKPFSSEIYALAPMMKVENDDGTFSSVPYGVTRCFPKGGHPIIYQAEDFRSLPIGHGRVEVITGRAERKTKESSDYAVTEIKDGDLTPILWYDSENIRMNIGLVFPAILVVVFFATLIVFIRIVFFHKRP